MATIAQEYIREGFEQGRINMLQEDVLDLLHIRFEPVGTTVREQITAVTSITILRQLHREAATADSMATFIEKLAALTDRA